MRIDKNISLRLFLKKYIGDMKKEKILEKLYSIVPV